MEILIIVLTWFHLTIGVSSGTIVIMDYIYNYGAPKIPLGVASIVNIGFAIYINFLYSGGTYV